MPEELTAEQAAARLQPRRHAGHDRSAPASRPRSCARSANARTGPICASTARCSRSLTELFSRKGVHYLSGFFGPLERALRDSGADIGFTPADFRRFGPLLERQRPRVMTTVATPPDADGWCSLSLHAGGTIGELHRAGADPDRLLVVEVSDAYPRTFGLGEKHGHAAARRRDRHPRAFDRRAAGAARRRRAAHRRRQGDRPARRRIHPVRRDPADGHRLDPQPDRHAAGRGGRRRLRTAQRDVHRRLHAAASRGQDHQRRARGSTTVSA